MSYAQHVEQTKPDVKQTKFGQSYKRDKIQLMVQLMAFIITVGHQSAQFLSVSKPCKTVCRTVKIGPVLQMKKN